MKINEMKEVWLKFKHSFHTVQVGMSQQVPVAHVALGNNRHVEGSQQGLSQLSRKPQSHSSPCKKMYLTVEVNQQLEMKIIHKKIECLSMVLIIVPTIFANTSNKCAKLG